MGVAPNQTVIAACARTTNGILDLGEGGTIGDRRQSKRCWHAMDHCQRTEGKGGGDRRHNSLGRGMAKG